MWPGITAMVVLTVASGFFSGSETALFCLTRDEVRRMKTGSRIERLAAALLSEPDRLLTAVLFWNLVTNLSYFAASLLITRRLAEQNQTTLAGVFSAAAVGGIILFGEVGPKSVAVLFRKPLALWACVPLAVFVRVLDPVLPILGTLTGALRRAVWPGLEQEPYLDVEDIERAVDTSEGGGDLVLLEQKILQRILDLSDMTAEEVMRPRGTFPLLTPPVDLAPIRPIVATSDYLFFSPTSGEEVAVSVIPLHDVSSLPDQSVEREAEPIVYFPWCGHLADLLSLMRLKLCTAATIVNEYGEMVGVVTEDDLIDTLVNPTASRARRLLKREPIIHGEDGTIYVEGVTTLRYLAERLGFEHEPDAESLLTVTGLLYDTLQRLPNVGDYCDWHGYRISVVRAAEKGGPLQVSITPATSAQPSHP